MRFSSLTNYIGMIALLLTVLTSCGSQANTENIPSKPDSTEVPACAEKTSADDFDNFLGIQYAMNELKLESVLGPFTGGEYTADSSSFIYYFKKIKGAPITIWVDAASQKVITVFMEVLGYEELFQSDLDEAIREYEISPCDSKFFGINYDQLVAIMGTPDKDETLKSGVRAVDYDSKDYKHSVKFKFYPDQNNICSSISVNWFY